MDDFVFKEALEKENARESCALAGRSFCGITLAE